MTACWQQLRSGWSARRGRGTRTPSPGSQRPGGAGPARRSASAAILLLDAGHQLLLRVVVGDGRLPLGPLVAAAWGSAGQKHRRQVRRQDVAFRVVISAGQSHGPCAELFPILKPKPKPLPWGHLLGLTGASACPLASSPPPSAPRPYPTRKPAPAAPKGEGPRGGRIQFKSQLCHLLTW